MTELDAYKPKDAAKQEKPAPGGGDGNHVTYQLYYRPEQAKFSNNARVGALLDTVKKAWFEAVYENFYEAENKTLAR